MRFTNENALAAGLLLLTTLIGGSARAAEALEEGFSAPPEAARPRVWWHWLGGNVTQEGITRDLEWMKRIGIAGVQTFDASLGTPALVDQPLMFMTPPWRDAFKHAARTADRLGLELSIAASPGWSETGGPWVKPQQAMKKLVWSETIVRGRTVRAQLVPPPGIVGRYQDQPLNPGEAPGFGIPSEGFYRDVAVIAYPVPSIEANMPTATLTTNTATDIDAAALADGRLARGVTLPFTGEEGQWLQWDFGRPQSIQAVSLAFVERTRFEFQVNHELVRADLQSSVDGKQFTTVTTFHDSTEGQRTKAFPAVTARYFRLVFPRPPAPAFADPVTGSMAPRVQSTVLGEAKLHAAPRIDRAEQKAGFFQGVELSNLATPHVDAAQAISSAQVIDVSVHMRPDGSFSWNPPSSGPWMVMRLGYSLTGQTNGPATPAATGLEVDKLNREHVQSYLDAYLAQYHEALGSELRHVLRGFINDSWEAGPQNWTEAMREEFRARRGYDLLRWIPALTGRVVDSTEKSDAFLWDFRRTLGEMIVDHHYGTLAQTMRRHNLVHYVESHESGRAFASDGMDVKREATVPMSATWVEGGSPATRYDADVRESASVAHLYGQTIVAAESFTTLGPAFGYGPADLKSTADRMMANGLNRFVIHTSVHQPFADRAPGFALGPFGQYFTRHETWAEQATPWIDYLARSSYLLQQGRHVADFVYFYGEDSNVTALYSARLPDIPSGYAYDFISANGLDTLAVGAGDLVTKSGMRYRALVLDARTRIMSLDALRRLAALVKAGATIVGERPTTTPSLADDATEFNRLVAEIWGEVNSTSVSAYGSGRVIQASSSAAAVSALAMTPDVSYAGNEVQIAHTHRRTDSAEIYFLSARGPREQTFEASFRVAGTTPELWHADSGKRDVVSHRFEQGRTVVPLTLAAGDAVFVVFRGTASGNGKKVPATKFSQILALDQDWRVTFQPGRGAPGDVSLARLESLARHADPGVKYFAGTATYRRNFALPRTALRKGTRIELDLGVVKNIAEVQLNGKHVGIAWKPPYRLDVTDVVRSGSNQLEVRVTNLWPNRMIGDQQPGATKIATSTLNTYRAESPLLDAGLIGSVSLLQASESSP